MQSNLKKYSKKIVATNSMKQYVKEREVSGEATLKLLKHPYTILISTYDPD